MAPQNPIFFTPSASTDWIDADSAWFEKLSGLEALSLAERVHLARIALQQQWICDIEDTPAKRAALKELGIHTATTNLGYIIASGNAAMAEYFAFRSGEISTVEAGIFYGYAPSAVVAFTGIVQHVAPEASWMTSATYFLGGAYSRDHSDRELELFTAQWDVLKNHAPTLCSLAEMEFERIKPTLVA
jgi:hypothetical protein